MHKTNGVDKGKLGEIPAKGSTTRRLGWSDKVMRGNFYVKGTFQWLIETCNVRFFPELKAISTKAALSYFPLVVALPWALACTLACKTRTVFLHRSC